MTYYLSCHVFTFVRSLKSKMGLCYCPGTTTTIMTTALTAKTILVDLSGLYQHCYVSSLTKFKNKYLLELDISLTCNDSAQLGLLIF